MSIFLRGDKHLIEVLDRSMQVLQPQSFAECGTHDGDTLCWFHSRYPEVAIYGCDNDLERVMASRQIFSNIEHADSTDWLQHVTIPGPVMFHLDTFWTSFPAEQEIRIVYSRWDRWVIGRNSVRWPWHARYTPKLPTPEQLMRSLSDLPFDQALATDYRDAEDCYLWLFRGCRISVPDDWLELSGGNNAHSSSQLL